MRPTRIWLIGALLLLLATAAPVQAASTYTVNPALPDNTQCATLRLCRTIQAAIDAASSGDKIDIADLSATGGAFGTSVTPDTGADVNGDGFINVFDLVLAGGNYGLTASTWTP